MMTVSSKSPTLKWSYILIAVAEAKEDWCAAEIVSFAEATFEITLVAPVQETQIAAIYDKPRWTGVGLDHIAELRVRILETGWRMAGDSVFE